MPSNASAPSWTAPGALFYNGARTIVVAEEYLVDYGLGSMVAQALASEHPVPMGLVGMRGRYEGSGRWDALLEKYGLTTEAIAAEARRLLERKGKGS